MLAFAAYCEHGEGISLSYDGQVAGKYIKGAKLRGSGGSLAQKIVGLGYQQVCGDAEVWGDGITPVPAAHLNGDLLILGCGMLLRSFDTVALQP